MKVKVLGCATSTGVPIVGCRCPVCTSDNVKNRRTRSSVFVEVYGKNILIDTSTDLRTQALREGITRIDLVLYTHSHADHTHGIDDLKAFNFMNSMNIDCYANAATLCDLKRNFAYIFDSFPAAGGKPRLNFKEIRGNISFEGITIEPVDIYHADWKILGYRIGSFGYVTDCSAIPDESFEKLLGLDLLILGALRYKPHRAHFNVEDAVSKIKELSPKKALLTHMGHELEYEKLRAELPDHIEPAYDGVEIELRDP
ncbi:MAG: MBL fold metallo-hydrolase [Candidatus Dadabacteria bacterium]|nr:MBL fold metallo-hydrolase [Candidatus Dadabacteria bacterium]MCY4262002.1 MBL fold metallo-hydrolase [Candidatus Dadabacteria bacterium]